MSFFEYRFFKSRVEISGLVRIMARLVKTDRYGNQNRHQPTKDLFKPQSHVSSREISTLPRKQAIFPGPMKTGPFPNRKRYIFFFYQVNRQW
jgi:hypothetical protein